MLMYVVISFDSKADDINRVIHGDSPQKVYAWRPSGAYEVTGGVTKYLRKGVED